MLLALAFKLRKYSLLSAFNNMNTKMNFPLSLSLFNIKKTTAKQTTTRK